MRRLVYLSGSYIPSRRANSVQVMNMCAAFSAEGVEVTLVAKGSRGRELNVDRSDHDFYGLPSTFNVHPLPRPRFRGGGMLFAVSALAYLAMHRGRFDLAYAREPTAALSATRLGFPVVLELHAPPRGRLQRSLFNRTVNSPQLRGVVFISEALRRHMQATRMLPHGVETVVAHDAVSLERFAAPKTPRDPEVRVGYVGSFSKGKGVRFLIEVAREIEDMDFHLFGGSPRQVRDLLGEVRPPPNVRLHGHCPPADLPEVYGRLDMVVMPYRDRVFGASGGTEISRWMSPLKMFEYMAAGLPIVSADLPVIREVLQDGETAILVPPEDRSSWVAALRRLAADPELGGRLGRNARQKAVREHTWSGRAQRVLEAFGTALASDTFGDVSPPRAS